MLIFAIKRLKEHMMKIFERLISSNLDGSGNYRMLGKKFFSYSVLRRNLRSLITTFTGLDDL